MEGLLLTGQGKEGEGAYDFLVALSRVGLWGKHAHTAHTSTHLVFGEQTPHAALCVTTGVPASPRLCLSSEGGYTLTKVS